MIYLKTHPINENLKFNRKIEILNEISDIFSFLEDDFNFNLEYSFVEYEEKMFGPKKWY